MAVAVVVVVVGHFQIRIRSSSPTTTTTTTTATTIQRIRPHHLNATVTPTRGFFALAGSVAMA
jgi:hypothetical protein